MSVFGDRWMCFCAVAVLLLTACASHRDTGYKDQSEKYAPADHWVNVGKVAIVAARDGDAYLTASCFYGPSVALMSTVEVKDRPEARVVAFGFDGATPAPKKWVSRQYAPPRWGFEAGKSEGTDFSQTLAQLRVGQEVEVVVTEAGGEILHVHFSLNGADAALSKALGHCPS
jgi:hypothetical protein